jgi:hypothetical protein
VDQLRGPTTPCEWVEFGHVELDGNRVSCCRHVGSTINVITTPDDWSFHGSLTASYGFVPSEAKDKSLRFLRRERGMDVYLNLMTGQEVFVGRTDVPPLLSSTRH